MYARVLTGLTARRAICIVIIAAFSCAALTGIAVLLRGGDLGDTETSILGTTALIGAASVVALCCLTYGGTASRLIGAAGIVTTAIPLVAGLAFVWNLVGVYDQAWSRAFGAGVLLTVSLAHAALLLSVPVRTKVERMLLAVTLALVVVLLCLLMPLVLHDLDPSESFWRGLGVVAILDVLGTLALPAVSRMRGTDRVVPRAHTVPTDPGEAAMPCERLRVLAMREGRSPGEVLADALDRYESGAESSARVRAGVE